MNHTTRNSDPRITLRQATIDDVGFILDFIRQLADYEKMTDEVVADEATLRASLFEGREVAEVVIAFYDQAPVGLAVFFQNFSTFLGRNGIYLEDLFVIPEMRGKGVGQVLLSHLAKIALDRGGGRFEWSVLDWNVDAIRFYERLGAKAMDGWTIFRVTGKALEELARGTRAPQA
jgi:GNAT superfamily N-acetyltransferase